jgi:hypothetical protein
MALALGRKFQRCVDGCGAWIIVAPTPTGKGWIPLEMVGEVDDPDKPGNKFRVMEIHHDNCTNPRIPGNRDPARSHRIAKHEDEPALVEEQQQFQLHRTDATEG